MIYKNSLFNSIGLSLHEKIYFLFNKKIDQDIRYSYYLSEHKSFILHLMDDLSIQLSVDENFYGYI